MEEAADKNDPLGILSSKPAAVNADPLGILKKKELTSLPSSSEPIAANQAAPSVVAGGTSGLTNTSSASPASVTVKPGSNFDPFSQEPEFVKDKTALGNKMQQTTIAPVSTTTGGKTVGQNSQALSISQKTKQDAETKKLVDQYENYKVIKSNEQKQLGLPEIAADDSQNTIDFYMDHLKDYNPNEYNRMIQKQEYLSTEKDPLKAQEHQAELLQGALSLKNRVMGGKFDIARNAIEDNYKQTLANFDKTTKSAEGIANQIKGIDDFLGTNYQVDQNGQLITNPTNRKIAEDMLGKRNQFMEQLKGHQEELDKYSQDQDLNDAVSLLDGVQKDYDLIQKTYQEIKNQNPEVFKGLPEYRKQLVKEKLLQQKKDYEEDVNGGDFGIKESISRGITGLGKTFAFIPKLADSNEEYDWKDKLYDNVSSNIDKFDAESNPLPTGYNKPVYENGKWNLQYLPGKIAGTLTEMAPMIAITAATEGATAGILARMGASGELSTALGSFAGEYVTQVDDYYSQAREAGMSEKDATSFSRNTAGIQALIGAMSPDINLARSNAFKDGVSTFTKVLSDGKTRSEALKQATKQFTENLMKEVPQENLQTWKEIQDQNDMYEEMGLNDQIKKSVKNDLVETTVISALTTMGLSAKGIKTPSKIHQEAMFMAASQPDVILERAQKMFDAGQIDKEKFDNVTIQVAKASEALKKVDPNLDSEKKSKIITPLVEKMDLKQDKTQLDESQHDLINDQIKNKEEEIKNIINSPSDEQVEEEDRKKAFDEFLKPKEEVKIPDSENKMQKEGMIDLDKSETSQPIELSINPETKKVEEVPAVELNDEEKKSEHVKLLEQEKADLKQSYFNEKIGHVEYRVKNDELDKKINALNKPVEIPTDEVVTEAPKEEGSPVKESVIAEKSPTKDIKTSDSKTEPKVKKEESKFKPIPHNEQSKVKKGDVIYFQNKPKDKLRQVTVEDVVLDKDAEGNVVTIRYNIGTKDSPHTPSSTKFFTKTEQQKPTENGKDQNKKTETSEDGLLTPDQLTADNPLPLKKAPSYESLLDEEEESETKPDDKEALANLNKDLDVLKKYNQVDMPGKDIKDLATKKYMAMIERAYKARLDGKISKPTYTAFRNAAGEILGPKIAERNREVKGQIDAIKEKVKERLLGNGYKNVALSSGLPVTPQMVEKLIDVTADLAKRAVDAGFTVREGVQKALEFLKSDDKFKSMLEDGNISKKKFSDIMEAAISRVETPPEFIETEKPVENVSLTDEGNKSEKPINKEVDDTEKPKTETKSPKNDAESPEKESKVSQMPEGESETTKTGKRVAASEKYSKLMKSVPETAFDYKKVNKADIEKYVNDQLDKFEAEGALVSLANDMINGVNPFPDKVKKVAEGLLLQRIWVMSEEKGLTEMDEQMLNKVGGKLAVRLSEQINISATQLSLHEIITKSLPLSEKGVQAFVEEKLKDVQNSYLSNDQKQDVQNIDEMLREMVNAEINRITTEMQGKEWSEDMDSKIDSLKIDLSEC